MRTLLEFLRLTRASGRLWWRYLPRLGAWFCVGYGVHLLAGYFSTLLGPINKLAATLVFVAGVVAWVATLVLMIQSLAASVPSPAPGAAASPRAPSTPLDAVVQSVGPFMAVYALLGAGGGAGPGVVRAKPGPTRRGRHVVLDQPVAVAVLRGRRRRSVAGAAGAAPPGGSPGRTRARGRVGPRRRHIHLQFLRRLARARPGGYHLGQDAGVVAVAPRGAGGAVGLDT